MSEWFRSPLNNLRGLIGVYDLRVLVGSWHLVSKVIMKYPN